MQQLAAPLLVAFLWQPGTCIAAPTNPGLTTLLFYTCATKEVANQCDESFTTDQAGIANVGFSGNFTTIKAGQAVNISTLFSIHDTFFINGKGLRPDWKTAWAALQKKLVPLIESKAVVGFFIGDELFPGKITYADFLTTLKALATMKKTYPHLVTWENEGGTGWVKYFKTGVPAELDIISLDDYYMGTTPATEAAGHRAFYEKSIYPLLKPHQKVFLVPGAFATHKQDPPPPPPPAPGGCAKCPVTKPHAYGDTAAGIYCCPTADVGHCGEHGAKTPECCLAPGTTGGCQGVQRCGTNPMNKTACHAHHGGSYPKGNHTFCYNGTFEGCDEYMADQAKAFAAWAMVDPRVAGFAPWVSEMRATMLI